MTPDGSLVAFIGSIGNTATKLYVWNSSAATLIYTSGTVPFNQFSMVAISPNGQKLAYSTGTSSALSAVDLIANTVSNIISGAYASHAGLQFSSNGRFLVYAALASPNTNQNVYLYDFQTGSNLLVSQNFNLSGGATGNSDSPTISPDGNFIAYRSFAANVVSNDFNKVGDLFIYDRSNSATIIVSASNAGNFTANDHSLKPVFSSDGQTLFLQSWASDVAGNDFNNGSDLFALDITAFPGGAGTTTSASTFFAQLSSAGGFGQSGQTPLISWPLAAGKTYHVQFTDDLSNPNWQDLPGNVIFIGDTGYLTDSSPPLDKRFYRIVLSP